MILPTFCPYCARFLETEPITSSYIISRCVPCNVRLSVSKRARMVELSDEPLILELVPVPKVRLR